MEQIQKQKHKREVPPGGEDISPDENLLEHTRTLSKEAAEFLIRAGEVMGE